jgi:hypothetical protein
MRVLEIELNGERLAVAGSKAAVLLSAGISLSIHESGGTLDVSGMEDVGNDVHSHLSWVEMLDLSPSARVTVKFVEATMPTPPSKERRTDSPQYASDQAEFEEELKTNPPTPRVLVPKQPSAKVSLFWKDQPPVVALFESGREFISCRFTWTSFRPDRCRVTFSSFSQAEALDRTGGKAWFSGTLDVGDTCEIELDA